MGDPTFGGASGGGGGGRGRGGGGGGGGRGRGDGQGTEYTAANSPNFRVQAVAFSPLGDAVASANRDGTIRFWNAATAEPLGRPIPVHEGRMGHVWGIAYSPDGARVVTASRDATIAILDARAREALRAPLTGLKSDVFAAIFALDGATLASAGKDGTIRLWNGVTGEATGELAAHAKSRLRDRLQSRWALARVGERRWKGDSLEARDPRLRRALGRGAYARCPRRIAPATPRPRATPRRCRACSEIISARSIRSRSAPTVTRSLRQAGTSRFLWDLDAEKPKGIVQARPLPVASALAFSPDSKSLAVAYRTGALRLWDPATGKPCGPPLVGHVDAALMAAFSPDGQVLASSGFDHTIRLWCAESGAPIGAPLDGHTDVVRSAVFSPDGKTLASASRDTTVRLWDLSRIDETTSSMPSRVLRGHKDAVRCVAYSSDGKRLATASKDATLRLWDAIAGEPITPPITGHRSFVRWVAFSPDGLLVASASDDGDVRLWNGVTGEAVGYERALRLWDARTRQSLGAPLLGHEALITWVAFSPDGAFLASSSQDGTVRIWDPRTGEALRTLV
jgi:WD40 repeat protein